MAVAVRPQPLSKSSESFVGVLQVQVKKVKVTSFIQTCHLGPLALSRPPQATATTSFVDDIVFVA